MRALVIDDSRAIRRLIGNIMKELGWEVTEAGHGLEALQQLEQHGCPDLILVDWNMPEMNGLEFIKAARALPEYKYVPMMMVTTETEMERMAQAFIAGVNEYLMKPFDKTQLVEKLQLLGIETGVA
ncbi:MAG TPA: response regulator [Planctomycetaceae bacterium]|nr:response regulator [Planctomycetaceae bacterium]